MTNAKPRPRRYEPAVGPRLEKLLRAVLGLFALVSVNSVYLLSVTILEAATGETYQNYFYLVMFLAHLALGLLMVVPVVVFGVIHLVKARSRRNRRAVRAGYALFAAALVLLLSGVLLTRAGGLELRDPTARSVAYWAHVATPLAVVWLFVLHRLAGRPIRWRVGGAWAGASALVAVGMLLLHGQDPRRWNVAGPESGARYFFPSLARTATGDFIPAETLMMDAYCAECHTQAHADWSLSAHRFASFSNPAYLAAVRETRDVAFERDGDVQASRFCAGCHDLVPFFSGAFDDPGFDDVSHPTARAGVTCTGCHAITHVNSPLGNADFTIEEPVHYPFAASENAALAWINRQLVKAKPALHRRTFLKPLHRTAEFCGACHKVHLPEELNGYKWLRGQDHYDSYLLSGVSGHGVSSFYYPEVAETGCNGCHMPLRASDDFAAKDHDGEPGREVHDHLFPSANTAIASFAGVSAADAAAHLRAHQEFNAGVMRVDLFALRRGGEIDGPLVAPLRPEVPALRPGETVLLDAVIRTVKMGHLFTEGTADSNEAWLEATVTDATGAVIGRSGGMRAEGDVDPWSHYVRAYVLDRDGNRIDRRNAQDIFVPLYSNQIPPGAADVVHYRFTVPEDAVGPLDVEVRLRYRKFDTTYVRFYEGDAFDGNDLPILELARDRVSFPLDQGAPGASEPATTPEWMRWNDYGIGLFRKGDSGSNRGELRQAEHAWARVEELGRWDGPLNLARLYEKEGRLADAVEALERAQAHPPVDGRSAPFWTVSWLTGLVNKENGNLDDALASLLAVAQADTAETRARGFDLSRDYRLLNEIGETLFEIAKRERGDARAAAREQALTAAVGWYERALALDPENLTAHYGLAQVYGRLGDAERAARHLAEHARYRPDDNARDRAVQRARERSRRGPRGRRDRDPRPAAARRVRAAAGEGAAMTTHEPYVPADDAIIGKAFRWSLLVFAAVGTLLAALVLALRREPPPSPPRAVVYVPPRAAERAAVPPPVWFTDVTESAGIAFERFHGAAGEKLLPETMGGGAAFLDHDLDGDADLLLVNGTSWPGDGGPRPTQAFYRNESASGAVRFADATAAAGLDLAMQGMGAATGDVDGDGDPDLFLTGVGGNRMLVNDAGRFRDATDAAGTGGDGAAWSTAAAFLDVENDGDLDLYVGNYIVWSREIDLAVDYRLLGSERAYGPPMNFAGTQPWLYRSDGAGAFVEVGAELGLHVVNPATGAAAGKALAAMPVDLDVDGWCDLLVSNDTVANFLYANAGGRFEERGARAGFAFDSAGRATGAMGIDAADYRNDGSLGVVVGNFANEMTSLYASEDGGRLFSDAAIVEGIGPASRLALSFGVQFLDYDVDGRLDLLQTNGHLEDQIHKVQASQSYRQPAQLFWNAGAERRAAFVPVDGATLGDLSRPLVGRGAACADVDGDGDVDVLLTQAHGAPLLLRNDQALGGRWLRVRPVGRAANRDAVGAWVEVDAAGATQRRPVTTARGYLTAVEATLTFGLGAAERADAVRVRWPGGGVQEVRDVPAGALLVIEQE